MAVTAKAVRALDAVAPAAHLSGCSEAFYDMQPVTDHHHLVLDCCRTCLLQTAKAYCREVVRILRTLKAKRDMSVNEARLIVSIEDPRTREQRQLGIEVGQQFCNTWLRLFHDQDSALQRVCGTVILLTPWPVLATTCQVWRAHSDPCGLSHAVHSPDRLDQQPFRLHLLQVGMVPTRVDVFVLPLLVPYCASFQDERGVSRDEMAAALLEVAEGRVPKDRLALKCLLEDMQVRAAAAGNSNATRCSTVHLKVCMGFHNDCVGCMPMVCTVQLHTLSVNQQVVKYHWPCLRCCGLGIACCKALLSLLTHVHVGVFAAVMAIPGRR